MKKRMFLIAMVGAMTMSLVACDSNINAGNTVPETEINETVDVVAEPQTVNASDLAPIASVISGVEDMKIQENTDIDLNELVYVDDTIVKSVDIDDSNVDYTKAGEYEVVYTIVFDKTAFNEYLDENEIEVNFDTDTESDTIVVTTTLTIEVVTEEVAAEIIDNNQTVAEEDRKTIVTNDTKENVKADNKSETKTKTTPVDNKTDKSDSKPDNKTDKPDSKPDKSDSKPDKSDSKPNKSDSKPNKSDSKPAHTHRYTGKVTKNATCESNGVKTYTCSCGDTYTENIAKTGHSYDNGKVTKNATCSAAGVKTYTCKNCGATRTESISATGHDWKHHEATGHEEQVLVKAAWDETVTEGHVICNGCGKDFGTGESANNAAGEHVMMDFFDNCENYTVKSVTISTVHHDAVYETKWVQDTAAYDECTKCGSRR